MKSKKNQPEKETEKLARMLRRIIIYGFIGLIILVFLSIAFLAPDTEVETVSDSPSPDAEVNTYTVVNPTDAGKAELVFDNVEVSGTRISLDTVRIKFSNVTIKNIGNSRFFGEYDSNRNIIYNVVANNKSKNFQNYELTILPGETKNILEDFIFLENGYSGPMSLDIERQPEQFEFSGNIIMKNESGEILDSKKFSFSIPSIEIGDTILNVKSDEGEPSLSLTLLSWKESDITVGGPYISGYYTFTAKPGMKFIILIFKFRNNGKRQQETPYLNAGEIVTDKGYIYRMWDPPGGATSDEYQPRRATDEETKALIGDSGGYEKLLPEESTVGRVIYEIPEVEVPLEASIVYISPLIKLKGEG